MQTSVAIAKIKLPKNQPRTYFDPIKMAALTASIQDHGILEPLIVRPLPQGHYELVAGERRLRASKDAGLKEIPVMIRDLTDAQAQKIALVENLQREDLNPVEEVNAILNLLALELHSTTGRDWTQQQVVSHLYRMQNEVKGKVTHKLMGSPTAETVERTFATVGLAWTSFISNKLPVLKWPDDVLEQTKAGAIAFESAKLIARIKDDKTRRKLMKRAITQSLSGTDIKAHINALKATSQTPPLPTNTHEFVEFKATVRNTYKKLTQHPRIAQDPERLAQAEQLFNLFLASLDRLLDNDDAADFYKE